MSFEPNAVIGRSCLLPGVRSPEELWHAVREGRDLLSRAPAGYWRVDRGLVLAPDPDDADDRTWTDRGGYVRGFDQLFDPRGFTMDAEEVLASTRCFNGCCTAAEKHSATRAVPSWQRPPILGSARAAVSSSAICPIPPNRCPASPSRSRFRLSRGVS